MLAKSLDCTSVQDGPPLVHADHIRTVTETIQGLKYTDQQYITASRITLIFILGLVMYQGNSQSKIQILCV